MLYPYRMPQRLEIALIRHGQSTANATGVWQGQLDFPLSDEGRAQARLAGRALAAMPPDAIYTSPLSRAHETARIIAREVGFEDEITSLSGLLERRGGLLEGTTAKEREARHPDLVRKFLALEENERWSLVGAETDEEVLERFISAIGNVTERHLHGGHIAVVSHGGAIRAFLREFFGPEVFPGSQRAGNASITRLLWGPDGEKPHLLELNSTGHLAPLDDLPGA